MSGRKSDLPAPTDSHWAPAGHSRRQFLGRAGAGALALGLGAAGAEQLLAPPSAQAAAAFGFSSSGGFFTVNTGAGLTFKINQSDGDMTSLNYNGTELQDQSSFSQVESGLGSGASVTASQTGNFIVITESVTDWYGSGTLFHYLVAVSGQNNIYMATYVNSAGAGELRWISRLNSSVINTVLTPAEINGGTAIESTDIYLLDGQTRSKYYSNRQAMDLTVRGITGSGIGVYMAYGNRESSAGGPFFRDIEQQGTTDNQLYNYLWSAHNQTESQRLNVLYGPYALMVSNETTPAAPDMSFMDTLGLMANVPASGRGFVEGAAIGATSGTTVTVGWANSTAQYWASSQSNGDYSSPAMKPGSYTMTMYADELAVASQSVTVTAGTTLTGQNLNSAWFTPASPVFRIGTWTGAPTGFLNSGNLTSMHPSDARMASWGPVTYTVASSSPSQFPAYQFKSVNNPTTIQFTLSASEISEYTVRIGITAAYAGGRPQITVNNWTSAIPSPSSQPNSRSLTIGTYRGNNTLFTYTVPASAFVAGTNTMQITVVSGSSALSNWLSPAISYDCVEMYGAQTQAGNTVTVTSPGNQSGTVGTPVSSIQIKATDSASGQTLTYSATGLPPGLSISSSGLISGTPSTSGTFSVTVTAQDSTSASGSASFTWTVTGPVTSGGVSVVYAKASEWQGGFTASVTITNNGATTINGWTVAWTFPGDQQITSAWNATVTQSGTAVSATNESYNAAIAPGGNASFGFQGTWTTNDTSPATFTLNGTPVS